MVPKIMIEAVGDGIGHLRQDLTTLITSRLVKITFTMILQQEIAHTATLSVVSGNKKSM